MIKIKFDPKKWIENLRFVNSESSFTSKQKTVIDKALQQALDELNNLKWNKDATR